MIALPWKVRYFSINLPTRFWQQLPLNCPVKLKLHIFENMCSYRTFPHKKSIQTWWKFCQVSLQPWYPWNHFVGSPFPTLCWKLLFSVGTCTLELSCNCGRTLPLTWSLANLEASVAWLRRGSSFVLGVFFLQSWAVINSVIFNTASTQNGLKSSHYNIITYLSLHHCVWMGNTSSEKGFDGHSTSSVSKKRTWKNFAMKFKSPGRFKKKIKYDPGRLHNF